MILRPLLLLSLITTVAFADDDFPGLKQVMTPSEWAHSGMDQLSPDQLSIVDSALTRHYAHTVEKAAKDATARAVAATRERDAQLAADGGGKNASSGGNSGGSWFSQFGMPENHKDWHDEPVLRATVVGWASSNRFILDNKQVWEGMDYIPYELKGHSVEIQARPMGEYALIVDGKNTTIRVQRIQ